MASIIRKALSPAVGLAAEAIAHQKNKKAAASGPHPGDGEEAAPEYEEFDTNPSPDEPAADAESDEEDWQVDEAVESTGEVVHPGSCVPKGKAGGPASINDIVNAFISAYPVQRTGNALPCPVIIPQKRPGKKTRGFVRAYASALEAVGIDERTWMDFMRCFEESIKVSPIFDAVNIAVNVVGLIGNAFPSPALMAVVTAITAADMTAQRAYQRSRYNDFLQQLNDRFFKPLGLYVLIMTYDPRTSVAVQPFDLSTSLAKSEQGEGATGFKAKWKTLKGVTGTTRGEAQLPQAAELVFPDVEKAVPGEASAGWFTRSRLFVSDYMDKRAQAHYASQNPGNPLSMTPQFESKLGGVGTAQLSARENRQRRMEAYNSQGARAYAKQTQQQLASKVGRSSHAAESAAGSSRPQQPRGRGLRKLGGGGGPVALLVTAASGGKLQGHDARPVSIVRRTLKPGVMYLMVTNRPSEEQLAAARGQLEFD